MGAASSQKTFGLGVIGASDFAAFSADAYRGLDAIEMAGVFNRTTSKAETFARRFGGRVYASLEELVADPAVDVAYVATTPARHFRHAMMALHAGKHVLVEKPVALNLAEADHLLATARAKKLRIGTNFIMRYAPVMDGVLRLVRDWILGDFLRGQVLNCAGDAALPEDHWFWDEEASGGIFIEHGVHFFDLARSLFGEGQVISARKTVRPGSHLVDQADCEVRYGSQAVLGFYHGFHQPVPLDRKEWTLLFDRGEIVLRGWIPCDIRITALLDEESVARLHAYFPEAQLTVLRRFEGDARRALRRGHEETVDALVRLDWKVTRDETRLYETELAALMGDFLRWIEDSRQPPRATAEDGRAALALAVKANEIAEEDRP